MQKDFSRVFYGCIIFFDIYKNGIEYFQDAKTNKRSLVTASANGSGAKENSCLPNAHSHNQADTH